MSVTISDKGWIIETTNTCYGMLEQGGVSGRRELVTFAQLAKLGIDGGPSMDYNWDMDNEDRVRYAIKVEGLPTKVLRKGHIID